jgi:ribose 5-phosphate isomerase A
MSIDDLKRQAALAAFAHVRSGMRLGLGTGSTARHFVAELGRRLAEGELANIVGVPTSEATRRQAEGLGVPLAPWDGDEPLDLAVDGADEVDPRVDLVKGLGGALLREKAVELRARDFVVIADVSKRVTRLGERAPVPTEVADADLADVLRRYADRGARHRVRDGAPVLSDNGNHLVDLAVGPMADPAALAEALEADPRVLAHGLFLGMASVAYLAGPDGVETIRRP